MSNHPRRRRVPRWLGGGDRVARTPQGSAVGERSGRQHRSWLNRQIDGGRKVAGFSTPRHNRGDR